MYEDFIRFSFGFDFDFDFIWCEERRKEAPGQAQDMSESVPIDPAGLHGDSPRRSAPTRFLGFDQDSTATTLTRMLVTAAIIMYSS